MKWIRMIAIAVISALAAGLFALHSQSVELASTVSSTIVPTGDVFLLSREGELTKLSKQGRLLWTVKLEEENEDGNSLRYSQLISDRSGSVYVAVQEYKRQVDALGQVQEIILAEEIQTWNGEGAKQDSVLKVDKSTLSQYSTQPYIRKLQMHGDILLALCCDQGQFNVIEIQPYGNARPRVLASAFLEVEEMEDCAALSDGTLVYSTKGGGLFRVDPDGSQRDLQALIGAGSMAGAVSSDETDSVYFTDRTNGVLYQLDVADNGVTRLYSPQSVIHEATQTTFAQVRNVRTLGDGAFYAVSIDSGKPFCVRFGQKEYLVSSAHRGWDRLELAKTAAVFAGTALLLWLATWALAWVGRRSMLISRILLYFLPVVILVLFALTGGLYHLYAGRVHQARQDSLASAAKAAAGVFDCGNGYSLDSLRQRNQAWRDGVLGAEMDRIRKHAADVSGLEDVGIILYVRDGGNYFGVYAASARDAFLSASYLAPLSQEVPAETAEAIKAFASEGGSLDVYRDGAVCTCVFQPVYGVYGDLAGLLEARIPQPADTAAAPILFVSAAAAGAAILVLLWLLLVLIYAFRPLKDLQRCIREISAGNWNVKARASSGDELADISLNFNQMTEKLNQYISSMVLLNNEYIKFTPRELFQLLGKSKVTDLRLRDKNVQDISLLYVNFRLRGATLNSESYFALMNESFDRIFDVVDKNRGIIERFDGSGMLTLFPLRVEDALNTAISLKEIIARESGSVELKMLISSDKMLIGVAGNEKRQNITAISETIMDIYALNSLMDDLGTQYIITQRAMERVPGEFYFNWREIGAGDSGRDTLYEFLDGMDTFEKKLHLVTKAEFEKGITRYQAGEYVQARKHFANVLQTNEKDKVAMHYLMLCDSHLHGGEA